MRWLVLLAGCGRVGFDALPDGAVDAAPVSARFGSRPGATSYGDRDTYLDNSMPDTRHGLEPGLACDMMDVALFEIGLPPGGPHHVLAATVHLAVTDDKLEDPGIAELHEMLAQWSESESTFDEQFAGTPWSGAAGDFGPTFGTFDGREFFTDYVIDVPPEIVERWWAGTSHGIALTVTTAGVNLAPHEATDHPELRPELDVTYQP